MYNLKEEIMKRMFVYLWVMICSLGFTACSDDDGNGDTEKGYKVSKITAHFHEDEDEDEIRTYSYDSQGRMIKYVYDENQIVTYTYKSNQIVVNGLEDGEEIWKLNDNGYIVQGESEDEEIAYTYDNLDQLQKMEYTDGDIHIFTWRDGNIVKVVEAFGEVYESTSEFTYSSVENKVDFDFSSYLGDYHFYDELYNGSYFGKPNKNLVLTCQTKEGNETSNYRYEYSFNENGCVEKILQYEDDVLTVTHIVEYL